jgi:SPP1 family predicted phage head-tail adaptor
MTDVLKYDIGRLDRRIEIQAAAENTSDYGGIELEFTTHRTQWARVEYSTASERFEAAAQTEIQTVVFTVRYITPEVQTPHRIVYEGNTYDIIGVQEVGRRQFQRITATLRK